jgi:cytoskeletal protein RodZ
MDRESYEENEFQQPEFDEPEEENGSEGSSLEAGIGALLRQAREESGLDYSILFEKTRIRPSMLEALENEQWERLPSPVFVTGFIRIYAKVLGLDEDEIVGLYKDSLPGRSAPFKPVPQPAAGSRKAVLAVLLLLFAGAVLAFSLWRIVPFGEKEPLESGIRPEASSSAERKADISIPPEDNREPEADYNPPVSTEEEEGAPSGPQAGAEEEPRYASAEVEAPAPPEEAAAPDALRAPAEEEEPLAAAEEEGPVAAAGISAGQKVLKGYVKERTWIKIYVDEKEPKEYILRPGSEPEWEAEKGFEVVIGNAGGIDLEFEGRRMEDLGSPGQVVRLHLPEDYAREEIAE